MYVVSKIYAWVLCLLILNDKGDGPTQPSRKQKQTKTRNNIPGADADHIDSIVLRYILLSLYPHQTRVTEE